LERVSPLGFCWVSIRVLSPEKTNSINFLIDKVPLLKRETKQHPFLIKRLFPCK
jgi:hypothetical protein